MARASWSDEESELERHASTPGIFAWKCPCGQTFSVEGGQDGADKVKAISATHLKVDHPELYQEVLDLQEKGVHREFAEIFFAQWRQSLSGGEEGERDAES